MLSLLANNNAYFIPVKKSYLPGRNSGTTLGLGFGLGFIGSFGVFALNNRRIDRVRPVSLRDCSIC